MNELRHGGGLHEEPSRFLPGVYYFRKGNEALHKGDVAGAIELWKISAGWAMKDAQYNLGIVYFEGQGVPVDEPLGLAWLALAAERKNAAFNDSLTAAWSQTEPSVHDRANAVWRELRLRYDDEHALPAARQRFESELAQQTGSRVGMPGHMVVSTADGNFDVATFRQQLLDQSQLNFGNLPRATVDVGTLQPIGDGMSGSGDQPVQ